MTRAAWLMALITLVIGCRTGVDASKEGVGDSGNTGVSDADGDGYPVGEDCDDNDASVNPGATEVCDGVDNDCDDGVDEEVRDTWYADADGDGFGDPLASTEACDAPAGTVPSATDCDDTDPEIFPAAEEVCDGVDNDCDERIDEGVLETWFADADGDGFGAADSIIEGCERPLGSSDNALDCDDADGAVNPDAAEVCDGVDNDCDSDVDEADSIDARAWFADVDGDGYGDPDVTTRACDVPSGYTAQARDCDDRNPDIRPDAPEVCDGVDNDCDELVDDDDPSVDTTLGGVWYVDADGDGYGDASSAQALCVQPSGTVVDDTDCDDSDGAVHPGATEVCNAIDDDCDGDVDDADSSLDTSTATTWYADTDGDGYGDPAASSLACVQASGTVSNSDDCDDAEPLAWTGASETCDGADNDCDGDVDERVCLDVSNVDASLLDEASVAVSISTSTTINTDSGAITGTRAAGTGDVSGIWFEVVSQASGPDLGVFVVDGLSLSSGATLLVEGANGLVLLSTDDVSIDGNIDADGDAGTHGETSSGPRAGGPGTAGGSDGGSGSTNAAGSASAGGGSGAGGIGSAGVHYGNGGGGAGHCFGGGGGMGDRPSRAGASGTSSAGGAGGYGGGDGGRGGDGGGVYGISALEPLSAGSGGGGGLSDTDYNPNGAGGGGGGGGGIIQITVDGTLSVAGDISAEGGAGGAAWGGGGGGGSGGSVLLEALSVDISGGVSVVGGAGGDGNVLWAPSSATGGTGGGVSSMAGAGGGTESGGGGGGSGWLHLRYLNSLTATGTLAPDLTTACGSSASM